MWFRKRNKKLYNGEMINLIGEEIDSYRSKKNSEKKFFLIMEKKKLKKIEKWNIKLLSKKVNLIILKFFFLNFYLQSKHLFHLGAYHLLNLNQDLMQHLLIKMVQVSN